MDRKPQQQTLSIRISDSLREFLERSKQVISSGRSESVSTSDVAKILLESAKDDRLDIRLEVAELGQHPTEALDAIRRKWAAGQPRSKAEWIFLAQYVQVACEELTGDPQAPSAETYVALIEALLALRTLRTNRGTGLDRYYLENLASGGLWNERKLDDRLVPDVLARLVEQIRAAGSGKMAAPVGRCLYVALRDEEIHELISINEALAPYMNTLFRMAARGHWIKEGRPVRLVRDGSMLLGSVPTVRQGNRWLSVAPSGSDVSFAMGIDGGDLIYTLSGYNQIREFHAMLRTLKPGTVWTGVDFHGLANEATGNKAASYQFRRHQDGVMLGFNEDNWQQLKSLFLAAMEQPELQTIFRELSMIYGEL